MAYGVRDVLDSVLDRQSRSWLSGKRPTIDELLDGSSLREDADAQLDLIYNEIALREEVGEEPSAEEYIARYPHLRDALALHFEVHHAMGESVLTETARLAGHATVPDGDTLAVLPRYAGYELVHLLGRGGMGVV